MKAIARADEVSEKLFRNACSRIREKDPNFRVSTSVYDFLDGTGTDSDPLVLNTDGKRVIIYLCEHLLDSLPDDDDAHPFLGTPD